MPGGDPHQGEKNTDTFLTKIARELKRPKEIGAARSFCTAENSCRTAASWACFFGKTRC